MKIIFDFDHTIFNMTEMHKAIEEEIEKLGIDLENYRQAYSDITSRKAFSIDSFANSLEKISGVSSSIIKEGFEKVVKESSLYLYEDVIENFEQLKEGGHNISLLSWGDAAWQKKKIHHSGIAPYIKEVVTVSELKSKYVEKWEAHIECYVLINDKPAELKAIKECKPELKLIRMRRGNGKYSDTETPPGIPEVKDMRETIELIKTMKCAEHDV